MLNLFKNSRGRSIVATLFVAAGLMSLNACGTSRPSGKVAGKVEYKGKAVTSGTVTFHDKTRGVGATANLDASGAFAFAQPLEYGTYTAVVTPPEGEPTDPTKRQIQVNRVQLPRKTRDLTTSGLSFEVKEKLNDYVVVLKD